MAHPKVLVVDDEEPVRESIRFVLDGEGYEVFEASDGVIGPDMMHLATEPLVVILDLMMPRMSGLQVLQAVDQDLDLVRRCAFIVVSAARTFTLPGLSKYLHNRYLAVLPKPFEINDLITCVDEAGRYLDIHAEPAC